MSFKKIFKLPRVHGRRARARALAIQSGHSEYISGLFTCRVQRFSAWELFFSYIFEIISIYQAFLHSTKYEQLRHGTNRAVNVSKAVGIKNLNNFSSFFLLRWHSRRLRLFRTMALLFIYAYFINLTLLIVGVTVSPIPFVTLWYGVKNNSGVRSDPVGDTANPPPFFRIPLRPF